MIDIDAYIHISACGFSEQSHGAGNIEMQEGGPLNCSQRGGRRGVALAQHRGHEECLRHARKAAWRLRVRTLSFARVSGSPVHLHGAPALSFGKSLSFFAKSE